MLHLRALHKFFHYKLNNLGTKSTFPHFQVTSVSLNEIPVNQNFFCALNYSSLFYKT